MTAEVIRSPDDTLRIALSLARHGWHVFPVRLTVGVKPDGSPRRDKKPLVKWHAGATADPEQIATWWGGEFAREWIGVHAAKSGLVVVDFDEDKGKGAGLDNLDAAGLALPSTLSYRTRGGGSHHVYAAPEGRALANREGEPVEGVDIRAGVGLMVYYGPALDEAPALAPAPEWALFDAKPKSDASAPSATLDAWLAAVPSGKPTKALRKAAARIQSTDTDHATMLEAVGVIVKLGTAGERGAGDVLLAARERYVDGWGSDYAGRFDAAAEGSVRHHGLPPVTFELSKAERKAIKARNAAKSARTPQRAPDAPPGMSPEIKARLDGHDALRLAVEAQLLRREADHIVAELVALQNASEPPEVGTADELLAQATDVEPRVESVWPGGGSLLLVGQNKTGKTTMLLQLLRSLIDGSDFLGRFPVRPVAGRVMLLNYEVTGSTIAEWIIDTGMSRAHRDRLIVVNLRGRENLLATESGRARQAELMRAHGVEVLAVDVFGAAFSGDEQNNASQVSRWLADLDATKQQGGASELVLVAHAGWGEAGRVRGSSALEGWADSILRYTRDGDSAQAPRYIEAIGRDVDVPQDRVEFDPLTRRLVATGAGSKRAVRRSDKAAELADPILEVVTTSPGMSTGDVAQRLRKLAPPPSFSKGDESVAVGELVKAGRLIRIQDGRHKRLYLPGQVPDAFAAYPSQ